MEKKPKIVKLILFTLAFPLSYYVGGLFGPVTLLFLPIVMVLHFFFTLTFWIISFKSEYRILFITISTFLTLSLITSTTISHIGIRDFFRVRISENEYEEIVETYRICFNDILEKERGHFGQSHYQLSYNDQHRVLRSLKSSTAIGNFRILDHLEGSSEAVAISFENTRNGKTYLGIIISTNGELPQQTGRFSYRIYDNMRMFISGDGFPLNSYD